MSEKLKTIKELADELGVSKSYIDKIIRILKLHTKLDKVGNKYVISKKQEKSIITKLNHKKYCILESLSELAAPRPFRQLKKLCAAAP